MESISDQQRVRDKIIARRLQEQQRVLEEAEENLARAALCTDNRLFKAAVPGLEESIKALEFTSPPLYSYVRKMELAEFTRVSTAPLDAPVASAPAPAGDCQRTLVMYDLEDAIEGLSSVSRSMQASINALKKTRAGLSTHR